MALEHKIKLPNHSVGRYIRLGPYRRDPIEREASAQFLLYTTRAARDSAPAAPLCVIFILRLAGDKFDQYFSASALAKLKKSKGDLIAHQFYRAAKREPLLPGAGLRADQLDLTPARAV